MIETWDKVWDKNKLEWNKRDLTDSEIFKNILEIINDYFKKKKKKVTELESAELGAGVGLFSYFLNERGFKTTLIDNSKNAKKMAAEWWAGKKYNYLLEDLFSYDAKKFDVVVSFGLCEHFSDEKREKVLKKHLTLLNKNGIMIISVPYKNGIFYQLSKLLAKIFGFWNFGKEIAFSKKEFKDFANKNNLDYKFIMGGFYSSAYDLVIRKPLKVLGLNIKRRGDNTFCRLDNYFGSGIIFLGMKKETI